MLTIKPAAGGGEKQFAGAQPKAKGSCREGRKERLGTGDAPASGRGAGVPNVR